MTPTRYRQAITGSALRPVTRLVALVIAGYADRDGVCFPAYGTVAAAAGLSRRAVICHVEALVDAGYLLRFGRTGSHGHRSNVYRLVAPDPVEKPPVDSGENLGAGVHDVHYLVNDVHSPRGERRAPITKYQGTTGETAVPIVDTLARGWQL